MPSDGPSKEDLQNYWNTSRQYFDELAAYYKTSDPQYYNEYIAPFYSNPFNAISTGKKSSSAGRSVLIAVFLFIAIMLGGFAVFFISMEKGDTNRTKEVTQPREEKELRSTDKDLKDAFPDDDFIIGSKYIAEKDYDKAEEHLRKIKPGSKNYKEAQQLLQSLKYLRKNNK